MVVNFEFSQDVDKVYKTITNPEFLKERALQLGSMSAESEAQQIEANNQVTLVRERKIKVPFVFRRMLKSIQIARTKELWCRDGRGYSCQNSTEIEGAPLTIAGQITLSPSDNGCSFQANFEADAKIALIGKTLKKYAGKTVAKEIELECEYTADYLAG